MSVVCRVGRTGRAAVLAAACAAALAAAQSVELEREVADLEARIAEARRRIASVTAEIEQDKESYRAHEDRLSEQLSQGRAEGDSLRGELRRLRTAADSVGRVGQELRTRQSELDMRQQSLVRVLSAACDSLDTLCARLPPSVQTQRSALQFLRAELASGSVEPGEALERLWHLHLELDQAAAGIDVYSETSPTPLLSGQVDIVRLGLCYLAASGEQRAALWRGGPADSAWVLLDESDAAALRTAVQVRRGNMVPQLVGVPLQTAARPDTVGAEVQP